MPAVGVAGFVGSGGPDFDFAAGGAVRQPGNDADRWRARPVCCSLRAVSYSAGSAARNIERDSRAHAVSMRDFFTPGKNLRDAQAS
jgi:hypothetical protein